MGKMKLLKKKKCSVLIQLLDIFLQNFQMSKQSIFQQKSF